MITMTLDEAEAEATSNALRRYIGDLAIMLILQNSPQNQAELNNATLVWTRLSRITHVRN